MTEINNIDCISIKLKIFFSLFAFCHVKGISNLQAMIMNNKLSRRFKASYPEAAGKLSHLWMEKRINI